MGSGFTNNIHTRHVALWVAAHIYITTILRLICVHLVPILFPYLPAMVPKASLSFMKPTSGGCVRVYRNVPSEEFIQSYTITFLNFERSLQHCFQNYNYEVLAKITFVYGIFCSCCRNKSVNKPCTSVW